MASQRTRPNSCSRSLGRVQRPIGTMSGNKAKSARMFKRSLTAYMQRRSKRKLRGATPPKGIGSLPCHFEASCFPLRSESSSSIGVHLPISGESSCSASCLHCRSGRLLVVHHPLTCYQKLYWILVLDVQQQRTGSPRRNLQRLHAHDNLLNTCAAGKRRHSN